MLSDHVTFQKSHIHHKRIIFSYLQLTSTQFALILKIVEFSWRFSSVWMVNLKAGQCLAKGRALGCQGGGDFVALILFDYLKNQIFFWESRIGGSVRLRSRFWPGTKKCIFRGIIF